MAEDSIRQLEDSLAFKHMTTAAADKTAVDFLSKPDRVTSKDVHNMLMTAGFTPGLGNVADAADALLYAVEGEYGAAGLSMAAMIPFIGQAVSAKKALKVAKRSGEEMITLYRGVEEWHPGKMVEKGKFVGGGNYNKFKRRMKADPTDKSIWLSRDKGVAERYAGGRSFWSDPGMTQRVTKPITGPLLEFEIPKSYFDKFGVYEGNMGEYAYIFDKGLPKEFLTKVHK